MDTRKLFLYALLGLICFSLWDAWQKDYPSKPATEQQSQTANIASTSGIISSGVNSSIKNGQKQVGSDRINNQGQAIVHKLITVKTDVLDVVIDTVGGNIVQAKLLQYPAELHQPEPITFFSDKDENFYVANSSLISNNGPDTEQKSAQYKTDKNTYQLQPEQQDLQVKLLWNNKGVTVSKIFTFKRGQYDIGVNYNINNKSNQPWQGYFGAQLQRKDVKEATSRFQYSTFAGASISSHEKPYEKIPYKKLAENPLSRDIQGGWLSLQQRYFLSAWVPEKSEIYHYYSSVSDGVYTLGLKSGEITVPNGDTKNISASLYAGPEITDKLKAIAPGLELTVDYGWLWIISIFLFWLMDKIHKIVGNWGWSIILVTVLIKIAFFKLSETSYRSMARMKDLAPKMQILKERYGNDKQKLSQATMEMYRKEKINPLGGCLPMIVQIPVFIGLYYVLMEAVQLRQAPFMFWIQDLAAKDPYYILPILMGLSMFLQQKLSPQSPDPMQAKMMMFLPVIFTVFFLNFPSGLVLYWLANNCLSILQQWYINKKHALAPVNTSLRKNKAKNK